MNKVFFGLMAVILIVSCAEKSKNTDYKYKCRPLEQHFYESGLLKELIEYDSNCNCISREEFSESQKLISSYKKYKWGYVSTKVNGGVRNVQEYITDTVKFKSRHSYKNRNYIIKENGDTNCEKSCYYEGKLNRIADSFEYMIHFPCTGHDRGAKVHFVMQLSFISDSNKVYRVYEIESKENLVRFNLGELPSGNYELYGEVLILDEILGKTDRYYSKKIFVNEEFEL